MSALVDLTGKTFGNWTVLYRNGSSKQKAAIWRCRCELCGKEYDVIGTALTYGSSTKCRACVPRVTKTKPHRNERINITYKSMKSRCYNKNNNSYKRYGGRGITVCEEWKNSPESFFEWAFSHGYQEGLSIDRIDNNKGYEPNNCRWIPKERQSANRRYNNRIAYSGNYYTLAEACRITGVCRDSVMTKTRRHKDVSLQESFDYYVNKKQAR